MTNTTEREQIVLPKLPAGRSWPVHMLGEGAIAARLRETYARISHRVAADEDLAKEKEAALAWCRKNGNPHLKESPHG